VIRILLVLAALATPALAQPPAENALDPMSDERVIADFITIALGREYPEDQARSGRLVRWARPIRVAGMGPRPDGWGRTPEAHMRRPARITRPPIELRPDGEVDMLAIFVPRLTADAVAAHGDTYRRMFPDEIRYEAMMARIASGALNAGDMFMLRPTVNGAYGFSVAISDPKRIAVATPIRTAASGVNKGSGKISAGSVGATFTTATVIPAVTVTYNSLTSEFTGFPAAMSVTVTDSAGNQTVYPPGSPVAYNSGDTITFGGASFSVTGTPADQDTFTIGQNINGIGDNRNALLLGALQSANTMDGGTNTFQSAYAQLINFVGNKTNELKVTSAAQSQLLDDAKTAQQAESGVNLDEEAANLIRYQQAYQAAGKVMQTADKLFDVLLSLGAT